MARIRTIKPQHCADKELPKISLQAHLLWILNWCFSDDAGVFENDPLLIRSNLFPRRQDIRTEQVTQWLDQLTKARYIIPFTYNGVSYYINRTFNVHQKIDRPQPSIIPEYEIRRVLDECSTNVRPCIVEESKGEVKERRGKEAATPTDLVFPFASEEFKKMWNAWKEYKTKQHKFTFKSAITEQAAINELTKISGGAEKNAIEIILQSIAQGWKGLFPLKQNHQNGTAKNQSPAGLNDYKQELARKVGGGAG